MQTFKFLQHIVYPELIEESWKKVYTQGWNEYLNDTKISECPYDTKTYRSYWIQGWARSSAYNKTND